MVLIGWPCFSQDLCLSLWENEDYLVLNNSGYFCKLEIKDVRKFLFLNKTKCNLKYIKSDVLSQKPYHGFFVTASIQNVCCLSEM